MLAPLATNVVELPAQTVAVLGVMVNVGSELTVMVTVLVLTHPLELVAVKV